MIVTTLPIGVVANSAATQSDGPTVEFDQTTMGNVFLANETATIEVQSDAERVVWVLERYGGEPVANGTLAPHRGERDGEATLTLPTDGVGHYRNCRDHGRQRSRIPGRSRADCTRRDDVTGAATPSLTRTGNDLK